MNKALRNTWIIFIISMIFIYIKASSLAAKVLDKISAEPNKKIATISQNNSKNQKSNVKQNSEKKINGDKNSKQKTSEKKNDENPQTNSPQQNSDDLKIDSRFETMNLDAISLEASQKIINAKVYNKNKFLNAAIDKISENEIEKKYAELKELKSELERIATDIKEMISLKDQANEEDIKKTIDVIETMSPKQAAEMFSNLNIKTRKILLKKMDKEKISSILSMVKPHIATETFEGSFDNK